MGLYFSSWIHLASFSFEHLTSPWHQVSHPDNHPQAVDTQETQQWLTSSGPVSTPWVMSRNPGALSPWPLASLCFWASRAWLPFAVGGGGEKCKPLMQTYWEPTWSGLRLPVWAQILSLASLFTKSRPTVLLSFLGLAPSSSYFRAFYCCWS